MLTRNAYFEYFDIKQVAAISDYYITVEVIIKRVKLKAIIDSRAQGNFISFTIIIQHLLLTEVKKNGYCLILADKRLTANGLIDIQIKQVYIRIGEYSEYIQFDVIKIGKHDIILRLP